MKNLFKAVLGSRKLTALAFCLCMFGVAQAQEYRVGYVDADRILTESAPAKAVEKKLENDFSKRLNDLRDTQSRLKSMSEKLDKDLPVLSESQRLKRQRELADMSQDFQRKQRAYREDLMQRKNEEYSKVVDRAKKEIEKAKDGIRFESGFRKFMFWLSPVLAIAQTIALAIVIFG